MSILATSLLFIIYLSTIFGKSEGLASVPSPKSSQALQQSSSSAIIEIEAASNNERTGVILFHKPPNVVTSHLSGDSRSTVYEDVQSMKGFLSSQATKNNDDKSHDALSFDQATGIRSKLHAIGRLDADTTGLLLLTNDGGLVHHVTNPTASTHTTTTDGGAITKTYEALIMGHHDEESLDALWHGVDIGAKYGGMTSPVHDLKIIDHPNHKSTVVSIAISEGKNRQVRRMFHALGSGVMKLKRTHIGEHLTLEGVQEGQWRIISDREVLEALQWKPRSLSELPAAALKKKSLHPSKTSHMNNKRRRRRRGS